MCAALGQQEGAISPVAGGGTWAGSGAPWLSDGWLTCDVGFGLADGEGSEERKINHTIIRRTNATTPAATSLPGDMRETDGSGLRVAGNIRSRSDKFPGRNYRRRNRLLGLRGRLCFPYRRRAGRDRLFCRLGRWGRLTEFQEPQKVGESLFISPCEVDILHAPQSKRDIAWLIQDGDDVLLLLQCEGDLVHYIVRSHRIRRENNEQQREALVSASETSVLQCLPARMSS